MKQYIGDQGEVSIFKIGALPEMQSRPVAATAKGSIVSHSESGSHHLIEDGELMERTSDVPEGMRILYAIVESPTRLFQDASHAHGEHTLEPGVYEFRIAREYDPFAEQARMVAD